MTTQILKPYKIYSVKSLWICAGLPNTGIIMLLFKCHNICNPSGDIIHNCLDIKMTTINEYEHYDSLRSTIYPHAQPLQAVLQVLEDKSHL